MNDENFVFENAETTPCPTCDTPQAEDPSERDARDRASEEQTPTRTDEATVDLLTDTGADPDSDCKGSDTEAQESELVKLRGELRQLREELAQRDARLMQDTRVEREYAEFCDLYPDTPVASLPEEVWQDVKGGASLAAAYALAEKKRAVSLQRATDSNSRNRARSAGAVNNAQSNEFSPAEVRAMSSAEVRANLSKIKRSMQKWH